jgi:hypothetical protein
MIRQHFLALQIVQEILGKEKTTAHPIQQTLITSMQTFSDSSKRVNVCVVCFCEEHDLLSQWRGYSGGSYGYSLGFDTDSLNNLASSRNFVLGRCIYDQADQQRIVREICDRCLNSAITDTLALLAEFTESIIEVGVFFKDASFKEENEWRLVSKPINAAELHFQPGKSMIRPYYKFGFSDAAIVEGATVGPCPHLALSVNAVSSFLRKENTKRRLSPRSPEPPSVRWSKIPYRDW